MASIAGYILMGAAVVGLLIGHALFSYSPLVIAVQVIALGLMLWARLTFGRRSFHIAATPTQGALVTTGPYRYIRHPIYTAVCLFCLPGAWSNGSTLSVVAILILLTGAVMRILAEEHLLFGKYPEYREYAVTTKRMVPYVF
jgi:protein-S-isoprenylcysteine O-methyltransferase Ste14